MKPLFVLIGAFVLCSFVLKIFTKTIDYRLSARIAMSSMLLFTAIGHFAFLEGMSAMVPSFIPFKKEVVLVTGIMEILFAIALWFPQYRKTTGWLLILFLILILPANINAAINEINYQTGQLNGPGINYLWFRIPLQAFFAIWVYIASIR
ncbi:DoxX family protein [Flagellimonas crocea]|uniref:DoxX family protein n=1 Tax=Flagellimonas crocea TaxID=3067311 RepID=UPI00296FE594|nr:hypothetical protein [Muricauda sp. DH64]